MDLKIISSKGWAVNMLQLIKFEFRKVLRSKYMHIIFGIGLVLTLIMVMTTKALNIILLEIGESEIPYSGYFCGKSALATAFSLMTGIFVAIFACEDFNQQTNKNIIAKGYKRLELFYSKYIVSLILTVSFAIILVLSSLGLGYALYGDGGFTINDNVAVIFLSQLLCAIAYHAFFFAVSYSVARPAPALAINIVVPSALQIVVGIIDIILNKEDFHITDYVIDGVLANLSSATTNTDIILLGVIMLLVYIALSHGLGILVARKKQF